MKNILASLKNLVGSKNENKTSQNPADACISGGESEVGRDGPSAPPPSSSSHPEPNEPTIKKSIDPPSDRRLTGKVAGLPHDIRTQVNQWLDDGVTYKKICANLEKLGYPGFVHQYIQRWKDNGYKRWLRAQENLDYARIEAETAAKLAQQPNAAANLTESNEIKLALRNSRMLDAVDQWDDESTLLDKDKSKAFFNLSRSVTRQLSERTRRERFKADYEFKNRNQEISEEGKRKVFDITAPLTPEQRTAILDKIDELLGIRLDPEEPTMVGRAAPSAPPQPDTATTPAPTPPQSEIHSNALPCRPNSEVGRDGPSAPHVPAPASPNIEQTASAPSPLNGDLRSLGSDERNSPQVKAERPSERARASHWAGVRGETVPDAPNPRPVPSETSNLKSELTPSTNPLIQLSTASPAISPLSPLAGGSSIPAQPHDQIPVFDRYGAWIEWIPQDGPDSYPKFSDPIGFENRRKENICWINKKDPYPNVVAAPENKVCVINCQGRILYWLNKSSMDPIQPFYDAQPLRCRSWNTVGAWLAGWKESYVDSPCGALVADF